MAKMDMFINMGENIGGETEDKARKEGKDIDILGWSWGAKNSGTFHTGPGGGAGKAAFNNIVFNKKVDTASTKMLVALSKGSHIPVCKILVRKAGDGQDRFYEITMNKVMITSINTGGMKGDEGMHETIELNFAKVKVEYFQQDEKGITASAGIFDYDIAANAAATA